MEAPSAASSSGDGLVAPSSPVIDYLNAAAGHGDEEEEEEEETTKELAGQVLFEYLVLQQRVHMRSRCGGDSRCLAGYMGGMDDDGMSLALF